MKNLNLLLTSLLISTLAACSSSKTKPADLEVINVNAYINGVPFELKATTGKGHNHPTFAIWVEDMDENYLKTLFITRSYATGVYGHAALTDSTWSNMPGESYRPASLPYWTFKKGIIKDAILVPQKAFPFVDGHSGATPKADFLLNTQLPEFKKVRVLLEVNQTWDWNRFWSNNLYPGNRDYINSAQPSVVYAVTVDLENPMNRYVMNPIGHGHYSGEDGKLYTDLSGFTTALEIFKQIEITVKK